MYNKDGGRNQSRLRPQSSHLRIKMSGELPPIRRSGSNMVKHQDSFNRHLVLPSIEKQNTGQHVDLSPSIMHRISKKILKVLKTSKVFDNAVDMAILETEIHLISVCTKDNDDPV